MGQHDRADHRDEQDDARRLEDEEVARVEQLAERDDVGRPRGRRRHLRGGEIERALVAGDQSGDHLGQQHHGEDQAGEEIICEARAQLGEVHVEHHQWLEQEEHGDRADVDDDQQEGEELGSAISRNRPAALKKARISQSTECTGLRDAIVITPEATTNVAKR